MTIQGHPAPLFCEVTEHLCGESLREGRRGVLVKDGGVEWSAGLSDDVPCGGVHYKGQR